jgi:hypothetical protein
MFEGGMIFMPQEKVGRVQRCSTPRKVSWNGWDILLPGQGVMFFLIIFDPRIGRDGGHGGQKIKIFPGSLEFFFD